MCKIEYKLIELVTLFKYLVNNENFDVYKKILSRYILVLENIQDITKTNDIKKEVFYPLQNVFRLYLEAPPKDKVLGKYILVKMQDFYEDYSKIV
jgi:hypothetical protein